MQKSKGTEDEDSKIRQKNPKKGFLPDFYRYRAELPLYDEKLIILLQPL